MEIYRLEKNIDVICSPATTFPEGIQDAFSRLERDVPNFKNREIFGISRPENGKIVYKAGVSELNEDELQLYNLEKFTITKGNYITETIVGWKGNKEKFKDIFEKLISDSRVDPQGYCVEWYKGDNVLCMVKILP